MARHRVRRSARGFTQSQRRKLVWATTDIDTSVSTNLELSTYDLLASYKALAGNDMAGVTVIRTHLDFWVTSAVTAGDGFFLGMKVSPNTDIVTNSSDAHIENPQTDAFVDWMINMKFNAHPGYSNTSPNNLLRFDVRSKRRIENIGESLLFYVWPEDVNTVPLTGDVYARTLLALP